MACCGKSEIDTTDIKTNDFTKHYAKLKHSDKVSLIIRIQAFFRGYRARKRIQRFRDQQTEAGYHKGMPNVQISPDGVQNYDNPDVISIREQLGDFEFGQDPQGLGKREFRSMVVLENGARYEGEWLNGSSVR